MGINPELSRTVRLSYHHFLLVLTFPLPCDSLFFFCVIFCSAYFHCLLLVIFTSTIRVVIIFFVSFRYRFLPLCVPSSSSIYHHLAFCYPIYEFCLFHARARLPHPVPSSMRTVIFFRTKDFCSKLHFLFHPHSNRYETFTRNLSS